MAGLGFKDFQVGEVLTSSDVDGYLMQQAVMRFADSGARGSALGTAAGTGVALAEGMVSYLDDVNDVQVYSGLGWNSVGTVKQIVQTIKDDGFTSTSTSFTPLTGLSVAITPQSSSNKVLVVVTVAVGHSTDGGAGLLNVKRDATNIGQPSFGSNPATMGVYVTGNNRVHYGTVAVLDSPATTSAITYSVDIRTGSGTVSVNRIETSTALGTISTITAIEVAP